MVPCIRLGLAAAQRRAEVVCCRRVEVMRRRLEALVRGCGQAYALQTVEPVTYRCGTRRVCQARSSGSERDTRARPHAVAPMNCVPEDSRRRSTCTGRTHSPRARADGHQTPASTVAVRAPRRDNDAVLVGGTTPRAPRAPAAPSNARVS